MHSEMPAVLGKRLSSQGRVIFEKTVLEAKREEFLDDGLINAKSLCEDLEIPFEPPRRIRRKYMFGNGSKDVQVSYEDDIRRTMFSSIDREREREREQLLKFQKDSNSYRI
ncbi:uncharacterized protein TNCV_4351651 [Trichonephila clavipes]|nr:uncharacterized protein TNCV_4351651 [Trichonephila clavipes]